MDFDTLITNATIITVNSHFDIIDDGVVGIKDGLIGYVGPAPRLTGANGIQTRQIIDADGGLVMPGLVNTHTHLPMSLFRGLADDLVLDRWLNDHIFPAEKIHVSFDTVKAGTLLSCVEMLLSGTTTCCDGYFFEEAVAQAVEEAGLRGVLGQGVIDFPAPGIPDPTKNIECAINFLNNWEDRTPLITPSVFCHSPYTCSRKTLISAKAAATSNCAIFQVHVAETQNERELIGSSENMSPVAYLESLGVLDGNTLAVHAVWVDPDDIAILAKHHVKVSHNPESNMKLASGIAPVSGMLGSGVVVGLGTDGCASNNNLDLFSEMGAAARLHKTAMHDPTVVDAATVIRMATINGARAIGLADRIGSIEPGKEADLVVIDTQKPHLQPVYHPCSHIVYAARGSDVRHVMIAGRLVVSNYRIIHLDVEKIMAGVNAIAGKIRLTDRKTPHVNPGAVL
jgi:5-methylthioadenosine/S-adenosylhomocysteine deaminase